MVADGSRKKTQSKDLSDISGTSLAAIRKLRKYKGKIINASIDKPPIKALRHLRRLLVDCKDDDEFRSSLIKFMDQDVVTDLLTMYGASVSNTDEYIFDILYHLERTYHLNFGRVAPLVFGEKSVSNYHNLRRYGLAIHNRLTPDQVLDFVDPKLLWYTLLKLRDGQSSSVVELQPNVSIKKDTPYDVRYILRLFISILDDGSEVSCRKFVECNGLSLAFASLSLHSKASRALAYTVLFRYSQRLSDLSTEVFPERPFYVYLLKFFRNSVESSNQHIPHVVSHFMARVCKLLLHPEDPVFQPIMSFLVLKPTLDLTNIPEFYKLLMSSSTEHNAEERQWILKLLADSMLEPNDYNILQKRYGIKFCLSLFTSCISEHMSRKYILFMLSAALKHPTVAYDLFYRQNLQCWIALTMQQPWLQRWEACFLCHLFVTLMEHFKVKFHKPELKHEGFSYQLQTKICKLLSEKVLEVLCREDDEGKALWYAKLNDFINSEGQLDVEPQS